MAKGCPDCVKMKAKMKAMQAELDAAKGEEEGEDESAEEESGAEYSGIDSLPEMEKEEAAKKAGPKSKIAMALSAVRKGKY